MHRLPKLRLALGKWLDANPRVRAILNWEDSNGFRPYDQWTDDEKAALQRAYNELLDDRVTPQADPPPNQRVLADGDFPETVLDVADAWPLFIAHVANSLYVEIRQKLGWSLLTYSDQAIEVLLSSKYFFEWDADDDGYSLSRTRIGAAAVGWPDRGLSLASPPSTVSAFLSDNAIIAADRLTTIANLLEWSRTHLGHFTGAPNARNIEAQWQYRGFPPVSRVLSGTPHTGVSDAIAHRAAGCHGNNGFLKDVLRVVNIPMLYAQPENTGHTTPHFVVDRMFLSHGDDPYGRFAKSMPASFSSREMLIDEAQYNAWFGDELPAAERVNNIGRQMYELALVHLPDYVLQLHCEDVARGRGHAASDVAATFSRWYTVADLEAANLWERIEQRILERGGCGAI